MEKLKNIQLSIIVPALMEARRIEPTLDRLSGYLREHKFKDTEVIVVVAESPDGTAGLARAKAAQFEHFRVIDAGPPAGKGRDVRLGILEAAGRYRLFMDADLATPLHHLQEVRNWADGDGQILIAVRHLEVIHTGLRKWISKLGNILIRITLLPDINDTQCGFKVFSAQAAEELFRRQTILGWGFDMEILAIAKMLGYRIDQLPVPDWSDKPNGTFQGQVKSAAVETLGELAVILWRKWTGRYNQKTFTYGPQA